METTVARQVSRLAASLLIVTAWLVALASPASAGSRYTCPSGYFCVWTDENYDGTRYQYNNVGHYNLITVDPIGSAFNNRSKRTYLNELSGSSTRYSCFGAYDYDYALSGWQVHANSAFLSTYTNC
jgi:peptidase inhibitor family I36